MFSSLISEVVMKKITDSMGTPILAAMGMLTLQKMAVPGNTQYVSLDFRVRTRV